MLNWTKPHVQGGCSRWSLIDSRRGKRPPYVWVERERGRGRLALAVHRSSHFSPSPAPAPGVFNHACDTWIIGEVNGQQWNYRPTSTAARRGLAPGHSLTRHWQVPVRSMLGSYWNYHSKGWTSLGLICGEAWTRTSTGLLTVNLCDYYLPLDHIKDLFWRTSL